MIGKMKCLCGHANCKTWWLTGIGRFVQGSGFSEEEADRIIAAINAAPAASEGEDGAVAPYGEAAKVVPLYARHDAGAAYRAGYADGARDVMRSPKYDESCDTKAAQEPAEGDGNIEIEAEMSPTQVAWAQGWNARGNKYTRPAAQVAAIPKPRCGKERHELDAYIWKRDSEQEWVLEISGEINGTSFISRHTEPLTTPPEDVAGLPSLYERLEAATPKQGSAQGEHSCPNCLGIAPETCAMAATPKHDEGREIVPVRSERRVDGGFYVVAGPYDNPRAHGEAVTAIRAALATQPAARRVTELEVQVIRDAAEVLAAVGASGAKLPDNWRWPLIDELGGLAALMESFAQPAEGVSE